MKKMITEFFEKMNPDTVKIIAEVIRPYWISTLTVLVFAILLGFAMYLLATNK